MKWSIYEKTWLATALVIVSGASIAANATPLSFFTSIVGVVFVVLVAKAHKYANQFGIIMYLSYGAVAYGHNFYGDMMLNWLLLTPMSLIGILLWGKKEFKPRSLSTRNYLLLIFGMINASLVYSVWLKSLSDPHPYVDSASTVFALGATILLVQGFKQQWHLWTISNSLGVALWTLATVESQSNLPILIMWIVFLINGLWGWVKWNKMHSASAN